jgi:predicted Rossmann-fold nucleotide-binding protein
MSQQRVSTRVTPHGSLEVLSQQEVDKLLDASGGLYPLFRRCALAVLSSGAQIDDARGLFEQFSDFDVRILRRPWGLRLDILNAPGQAFVDGEMIQGVKEHLFAVLRDVVYIGTEIATERFDPRLPGSTTNAVFHILRNAHVLSPRSRADLIVCWGGHSVSRLEYEYTKAVGYELGLRGLNICTGCGPGAMKGPMKGAAIGHSKQRIPTGRYIGLTEPGIIAAEPPNPITNQLVVLPDIEKRMEAFVRLGHGIVVFPGGVGTAEEILYILGVLLHPDNEHKELPIILTGPAESGEYFKRIDEFIGATLGAPARNRYRIILDDPAQVAREMVAGTHLVRAQRRSDGDAWNFSWLLKIDADFQAPFDPTHEAMAALDLSTKLPPHALAAQLRRVFSGIVSGNVKDQGVRRIEQFGPYQLHGDPAIMSKLDVLLESFVAQHRMKIAGGVYRPCYQLVT